MKKSTLPHFFGALFIAGCFIFIFLPALPELINSCEAICSDVAFQFKQLELALRK